MINRLLLVFLAFCGLLSTSAQAQDVPQSRAQIQLSFAPLVKQTAPAVVNILTKRTVTQRAIHPFARDPFFSQFFGNGPFGGQMRQQIENALGSGVIVEDSGLIVTNAHVIREADEITVVLADGREFDAKLSLKDDASDIALLRIDPKGEKLPFVNLKPSESLEVGDLVLAIGNPFGVGQTVTSGIVSAQGRSALNVNDFNFFIQTDAAINPGNSGGALVALDGGVVGINTAIYSRDGGSLGIGFAIPSEMVASVIAAEKSGQTQETIAGRGITRPWLGVTSQNLNADIAESLGLDRPKGTLITALHPASPLRKGGVQVGDLIVEIDGNEVKGLEEVRFRMATVPLGKFANFRIIRPMKSGTPRDFKVMVKAIAPPDDPPRNETILKGNHLMNGAILANINPAVSIELGIAQEQGVVVLSAARGTSSARIVAAGDIVLGINGREIKEIADVEKALSLSQAALDLMVKRNGRQQRIVIR